MARQLTSLRTAKRYARRAGVPECLIVGALVRGGTGHRVDLCLRDGSIIHLWPSGATEPMQWPLTGWSDGLKFPTK